MLDLLKGEDMSVNPLPGEPAFLPLKLRKNNLTVLSVNPLPGEPAFLPLKLRKNNLTVLSVNPLPGESAFLRISCRKARRKTYSVNPLSGEPAFLRNCPAVPEAEIWCQSPYRGTGISTVWQAQKQG